MEEKLLRLIATTLSAPVLWLIVLLLFTGWRLYRRAGWYLLLGAWLCTMALAYSESLSADGLLRSPALRFLDSGLPFITATLFFTFALKVGSGYRRASMAATTVGASVLAVSIGVAKIYTGSWRVILEGSSSTPYASVIIYLPLIAFSTFATIASAVALRHQLRASSNFIRHLLFAAWLTYGVLQMATFLRFSADASYLVIAFLLAWLAKVSIAGGLFLLFKEDVEVLQARRIALESQISFSWYAHELKNPIHALNFRAESLSKRLDLNDYSSARADAVKLVQTTRMLNSIVESARLAAMPLDISLVTYFSVNDAASDAIALVRSAFPIDNGSIRTEFGHGTRVCGLRSALSSIFANLLRNALEACAELTVDELKQTRQLKVFIDTKRIAHRVRIRIIDYGPGIAPDVQKHMFDPYYSTKQGINRGLGLWVVRTLVESFHGDVSVTSPIARLSRGTVFEVSFPSASDEAVDPVQFFGSLGRSYDE